MMYEFEERIYFTFKKFLSIILFGGFELASIPVRFYAVLFASSCQWKRNVILRKAIIHPDSDRPKNGSTDEFYLSTMWEML